MKPWIVILIAALVIALIIGGVLGYRWYQATRHPAAPSGVTGGTDTSGLLLCEYSRTGGMENELYILTLTRTEQGAELTFERYRNPNNWSSAYTSTYKLPADALEGLYAIFESYGMADWPEELEKEEWELLDAPSVSVTFQTADRTYRIYDDDVIPGGGPLLRDVREALEALLPDKVKQ